MRPLLPLNIMGRLAMAIITTLSREISDSSLVDAAAAGANLWCYPLVPKDFTTFTTEFKFGSLTLIESVKKRFVEEPRSQTAIGIVS